MAQLPNQYGQPHIATRTADQAIDEGLRQYMLRVYNYLAAGLVITGIVAYFVFTLIATPDASLAAAGAGGLPLKVSKTLFLTPTGKALLLSPLIWVVMFAPLGLILLVSFAGHRLSLGATHAVYWLLAALIGVSMSTIFIRYTPTSIAQIFFITAAAFGALSLYGYTTKRDLSGWGTFLFMGAVGILIASIVNIWLMSPAIMFVVSIIGVLVFAGFTAYDTQQIKESYYVGDDGTVAGKKAVFGALSLYLDFVNMFQFLLSLFGNRE